MFYQIFYQMHILHQLRLFHFRYHFLPNKTTSKYFVLLSKNLIFVSSIFLQHWYIFYA